VADKGYHSNAVLLDLAAEGIRAYVSEPDRGRRNWEDDPEAQVVVYANRRRIRGGRGKRLHRLRGERVERPNAHLYETGGMRRTHLRGRDNILKRLLIHSSGLNLGLLLRKTFGSGTPKGLQGRAADVIGAFAGIRNVLRAAWHRIVAPNAPSARNLHAHFPSLATAA